MDQSNYNVFSFSGLSTMSECGHRFKLTRIDQIPEQGSFAMHAGTAFHSAADLVDELLAQEQEPPF
jgi:hypothetical protein